MDIMHTASLLSCHLLPLPPQPLVLPPGQSSKGPTAAVLILLKFFPLYLVLLLFLPYPFPCFSN